MPSTSENQKTIRALFVLVIVALLFGWGFALGRSSASLNEGPREVAFQDLPFVEQLNTTERPLTILDRNGLPFSAGCVLTVRDAKGRYFELESPGPLCDHRDPLVIE